jgi:hypothetical protein
VQQRLLIWSISFEIWVRSLELTSAGDRPSCVSPFKNTSSSTTTPATPAYYTCESEQLPWHKKKKGRAAMITDRFHDRALPGFKVFIESVINVLDDLSSEDGVEGIDRLAARRDRRTLGRAALPSPRAVMCWRTTALAKL